MITAKEIGKIVNVSTSTVYRAIHNQKRISPRTKKTILKIANQFGYQRNDLARSLVLQKTWKIGLLLRNLNIGFSNSLLSGILTVSSKNNYDVFMKQSAQTSDEEYNNIHHFLKIRVDGIIAVPLGTEKSYKIYRNFPVPLVFVDSYLPGMKTDYVVSDIKGGFECAVKYLVKKGHSHIALITRDSEESVVKEALAGYKSGFKKAGLVPSDKLIVKIPIEGVYNPLDIGRQGIHTLLKRKNKFTAVVDIDDWVIMGAISTLRKMNIEKSHLDWLGFDDVPFSSYFQPGITTIKQNPELLGEISAKTLIEKINGENKRVHIRLNTELIKRGSA
jgi:LacI family transcriptional regulator